MKIKPEECEITVDQNGKMIRHIPTNRCIAVRDQLVNQVSLDELYKELEDEINRLEASGELESKATRILIKEEGTLH